jgi:pimeloyl-ACP methyl ester carboxylesterase
MPDTVAGVVVERMGEGEPLLLIHGTGGTRHVWRPVVEPLARRRSLLLIDLPGHGESPTPGPGVPHNPIGYAGVLAAMLDELGTDRVDCAGNSVGGWTALELAKLGRARSVVALSPAGLWAKRDPWRSVAQLSGQHKMGRLFAPLTPSLMRSTVGRSLLLRGAMARPTQVPPEDAVELAEEFARTPDFDAHLASTRRARFRDGRQIDVPVTVAWGEKERLIPAKARRRDELPDHTHFVTMPGCGHIPMWDDPALVAAIVLGDGSGGSSDPTASL